LGNTVDANLQRRSLADESDVCPTALVVVAHRLFAEALTWPLEDLGMRVVIAANELHAVEVARRHRPSLVLMDIGRSRVNGLEALGGMMRLLPEAKIVALTEVNDQRFAKEALRRGFHGCVAKDTPLELFTASIKAVMSGEPVAPHLFGRTSRGVQPSGRRVGSSLAPPLTAREHDVLRLLVEGGSSAVIAGRLSISAHTVRSHIRSILPKLEVHSRLEAAALVVRQGLAGGPATSRSPFA
jgi:two-component system nitrate/nitrite response regulator NarL